MTTLKIALAAIAVAASSTLAFADGATTGATGTYQSANTSTASKPVLTDAEKFIISNYR
jgi:hypothetical protein